VRLRAFGRAGGGGTRRSSVLRGGASPALNDPALRGLIWAGVWPWSTAVACVVHWRARTGGAGLGTGSSMARAARRPRSSPERDAWAPRARQGLRDLAQGRTGTLGCSPRVGIGEWRGAGCSAAWTGGGACLGARGQADVGTLRVPGSLEPSRGVPAEALRWSGGTGRTRRRGIVAAEQLTGGGIKARFRWCRALSRGRRPL